MNEEEDMLELLDDEGTADQFDLELDEPEEEILSEVDESIKETKPEPGDLDKSEERGDLDESEEPVAHEIEIDIRLIIAAVVAIAAIIVASVFVIPILMPSGPPEVVMTPSQSGEDLFLYYESGPVLQEQDLRFTLGGAEIPMGKIMLMGGMNWPWEQGTVLKIDTSGYEKPATIAVIYTKGDGENLIYSTGAEPTPTPTPTPTPEPTPEPIITPEILVPHPQEEPDWQIPFDGFADKALIRFDARPTSGIQPLTVQFADQTQICAQNRSWDFGDGMSSNVRYPEHTYPFPGTYMASLDLVFCDPGESSDSPVKEITVLPVDRQDVLLSGPGTANIDAGGVLFFTVKGPGMIIRIGGRDHYLEKGDLVSIMINKGGTGSISIINNAIIQFNFDNVSVWINGEEYETGWLTNININQYEQIASSDITFRIIAREPGLKGLVNGIPSIVASPGQMITLHNAGTDSTGKLLFSIQDGAGFSFRGGIESYEVTTPF